MNQAHLQYERGCAVQVSRSSHFSAGGGGHYSKILTLTNISSIVIPDGHVHSIDMHQ